MARLLISRALPSASDLPVVGDEAVVIGEDAQAQRAQLACLEAVEQLLVKSPATRRELVQGAPAAAAAGHLADQELRALLALAAEGSDTLREKALLCVLALAGSDELREGVVAAAIEVRAC
jgi:hypothetical protein